MSDRNRNMSIEELNVKVAIAFGIGMIGLLFLLFLYLTFGR